MKRKEKQESAVVPPTWNILCTAPSNNQRTFILLKSSSLGTVSLQILCNQLEKFGVFCFCVCTKMDMNLLLKMVM